MQEHAYENPYRNGPGDCPNVLLRCVDFRFHRTLETAVEAQLGADGDRPDFISLGVPGGSWSLLHDDTRGAIMSALDIAQRRYQSYRVLIADHVDCGAYGGSIAHAGLEAERIYHFARLREARQLLLEMHPELSVILLYQDWETIAWLGES